MARSLRSADRTANSLAAGIAPAAASTPRGGRSRPVQAGTRRARAAQPPRAPRSSTPLGAGAGGPGHQPERPASPTHIPGNKARVAEGRIADAIKDHDHPHRADHRTCWAGCRWATSPSSKASTTAGTRPAELTPPAPPPGEAGPGCAGIVACGSPACGQGFPPAGTVLAVSPRSCAGPGGICTRAHLLSAPKRKQHGTPPLPDHRVRHAG